MKHRVDLLIVGAGASGLFAAWNALQHAQEREKPLSLKILEAQDRAGGSIQTRKEGGFLMEAGPDAFLTEPPDLLRMTDALHLSNRRIGVQSDHAQSWIFHKGALHPIPEGFQLLAPSRLRPLFQSRLLSLRAKARCLLEPFLSIEKTPEHASVAQVVRRRFGEEVLNTLARPLVFGVYNAQPEELGFQDAFPRFAAVTNRGGSLLFHLMRSRRKKVSGARYELFASFDRGMGVLMEALLERLPSGALELQEKVRRIHRKSKTWIVETAHSHYETKIVVLAIPLPAAAVLLKSIDASLAQELLAVPYRKAATLNLAYPEIPKNVPQGFGFVAHPESGLSFAGCTFSHVKFAGRAPKGAALFRLFLTQTALEKHTHPMERARKEFQRLFKIKTPPLFAWSRRHGAVQPVLTPGHAQRVKTIRGYLERYSGLSLFGPALDGVGLASLAASISRNVAEWFKNTKFLR